MFLVKNIWDEASYCVLAGEFVQSWHFILRSIMTHELLYSKF